MCVCVLVINKRNLCTSACVCVFRFEQTPSTTYSAWQSFFHTFCILQSSLKVRPPTSVQQHVFDIIVLSKLKATSDSIEGQTGKFYWNIYLSCMHADTHTDTPAYTCAFAYAAVDKIQWTVCNASRCLFRRVSIFSAIILFALPRTRNL